MSKHTDEELEIANDILSFIQNLDEESEALEFARLYIKAINNSKVPIYEDQVDESVIYDIMRATDARF